MSASFLASSFSSFPSLSLSFFPSPSFSFFRSSFFFVLDLSLTASLLDVTTCLRPFFLAFASSTFPAAGVPRDAWNCSSRSRFFSSASTAFSASITLMTALYVGIIDMMNGCNKSFSQSARSDPSLIRQSLRKLRNSSENLSGFVRVGAGPSEMSRMARMRFSLKCGGFDSAISMHVIPSDHTSLLLLCRLPCRISGGIYKGVPIVFPPSATESVVWMLTPKSAIFGSPWALRRMFAAFISRCIIPSEWRYCNPIMTGKAIAANSFSRKGEY
mmetsp:Transcript_10681/g.29976  ORF Transcript_10681/g.29976 Transcript_10681/m.29976 type:complete len:272 (-) Transcript_10681:231-1046(-)